MSIDRIAYLFVQFPKITETFNLREMVWLQSHWPNRNLQIDVYSLLSAKGVGQRHAEAQSYESRTTYGPWFFSLSLWLANFQFLFRRPKAYLGILYLLIAQTARTPVLCIKTIGLFPKSVLFARQIESKGTTHVHATFASHNTTTALIAHVLTGIPFSFTIDAYDLFVETSLLALKLSRAKFVTTISAFNIEILKDRFGIQLAQKCTVVRRGIDLEKYRPADKSSRPVGPFTIVCVGSLIEKKGQRYLLEALARLRTQGRAFQCIVIGDGTDRQKLEQLRHQLGLETCVEFAGALQQHDVLMHLHCADVSVLPSIITADMRMEGIPNALMESMACAVPTIGTRISGLPELIDEGLNGWLVPQQDSIALAEAIADIMDHPEKAREYGLAGREKVATSFNQNINIKQLMQLYLNAL